MLLCKISGTVKGIFFTFRIYIKMIQNLFSSTHSKIPHFQDNKYRAEMVHPTILTMIESKFHQVFDNFHVYTHNIMKGMCHCCYESNKKLTLTEVHHSTENPMGSVQIPLCDSCRTSKIILKE